MQNPRTIQDVKVQQSQLDTPFLRARIRIDWIGADGAPDHIERNGPAAALIINDLRMVAEQSTISQHAYLLGFIRSHVLRREGI